ncbi:50S ribosomal protein L15 [Methylococcales bacterium]|nr:50S ribosomal protein L15 [Methylococcales bacterium]
MFLNTIAPAHGSKIKKKRVGRGIGSTFGKTCGRGHKGQHARAGGYHKVGFEGGQMPLQRRLPKVGFISTQKKYKAEVRLNELNTLEVDIIDLHSLIDGNIVPAITKKVKIIDSGNVNRAVVLKGVKATAGAIKKIEIAGGKIEV